MRIGVTPNKSLAHKQTCLTLYRTLLRQTLLLQPELSNPLLDVITQRFHLDRTVASPAVIVSALQTARSALTLIHSAATNDPTSIQSLTNIVTAIQLRAQQTHQTLLHQHSLRRPTAPHKLPRIAHRAGTTTKKWAERIPNSPPILSRPVPQKQLPQPDKPRRVPYLVSAQGVPFLRYKSGSTSVTLSHVLRSRARQATKRWDLHDRLIEDFNHGSLEDNWDALVHKYAGIRDAEEVNTENFQRISQGADRRGNILRGRGGEAVVAFEGPPGSSSWTVEVKQALYTVKGNIKRMMAEREKTAREMKRIMEGERTLAAKEKLERKEAARKRWLAETGQVTDSAQEVDTVGQSKKEQNVSSDGMVTMLPFGTNVSSTASRTTEEPTDRERWSAPRRTASTLKPELRNSRNDEPTISPFGGHVPDTPSTNTRDSVDPGRSEMSSQGSVDDGRTSAAAREDTNDANSGRWAMSDKTMSNQTMSMPRKKTVRRPWDPDWVSKPRRWK